MINVVFRFGGAVWLTVPKRTPRLVSLHNGKATSKLFCFQNFMANPRHSHHTLNKKLSIGDARSRFGIANRHAVCPILLW